MDADNSFTVEYMVEMTCNSCVKKIENILTNNSMIRTFSINLEKQQVTIKTDESVMKITSLLEQSGKRVVLRGITTTSNGMKGLDFGSGVCIFQDTAHVFGVCRIYQITDNSCYFNGLINKLEKNTKYKLCVHELGDVSNGPHSCGDVFNIHSDANSEPSGYLGNLITDESGQCKIDLISESNKLWDLIGRSLVVHSFDLEMRIMCGVIARSSGAFQNVKTVCACDGTTVWEEKDRTAIKESIANL